MTALFENEQGKFILHEKFDVSYLYPVKCYVEWKRANDRWDDYDEYKRAIDFIAEAQKHPSIWLETHVLMKDRDIKGVLLIVGGKIKSLEKRYNISREDQSLLLKYFHILENGRGVGSFWMTSVVMPYYKEKGFRDIYVSSSHPQSFPFYQRLGSCIAEYQQLSDNGLCQQQGKCFRLTI